eukprot:COSAG02_NODE_8142_length_2693_cov_4.456438_3_plen_40_part_00
MIYRKILKYKRNTFPLLTARLYQLRSIQSRNPGPFLGGY